MKLNMEQRRIVELEPNGHMMVKGVAGSGKTTVAVRRISFLQNHYSPEEEDTILLVTYNKTLLHYIKYQYHKLAEEEQNYEKLFSNDSEVKIVTIDSIMYKYFTQYMRRMKLSLKTSNNLLEHKIMVRQYIVRNKNILKIK
ncbi:UvrD/REP helicase N-terminal domain-containing protein [Psychrobacillus insolitus]|uniref:UvrD/REP helicase N-terminal domain-containing protein n=1 Tax=Psychrobacillus insolitus TaxID=1461 RepID=A0A2W7MHB5_9BACI|nr:UvrD-helicase domain-containing protein [Psychrobacillus insolitus]PZX04621.1 UvrD/REP helicase N-terminal domain-containing protein [Psychrobacillus insolitus]